MVLYSPCKRKSCDPCWVDYERRIREQIVDAFNSWKSQRLSSFAGLIPLDMQNSTTRDWHNLRRRLNQAGREWVFIPQVGGGAAVLCWPPPPNHTIPVLDLDLTTRVILQTHERSRKISSSSGMRVAARPISNWRLMGVTSQHIERIREILEQVGLQYEWNGIDCIYIREMTGEQMDDLKLRMAA